PNAVVHQLVVPFALASVEIDRYQAFAKQSIAGAMSAEIVARGQLDGQVHNAELFIHRDLAPHARVAGVRPGIVQPGVDAVLAGLGDGVENPEAFAGANVESADVALHVFVAARDAARAVRGADDHDILGNYWSGVESDFARDGVDLLIVVLLEIDDAVASEGGNRSSGFGI